MNDSIRCCAILVCLLQTVDGSVFLLNKFNYWRIDLFLSHDLVDGRRPVDSYVILSGAISYSYSFCSGTE